MAGFQVLLKSPHEAQERRLAFLQLIYSMENMKTLKRAFTKHWRKINADLGKCVARQAIADAFQVNRSR